MLAWAIAAETQVASTTPRMRAANFLMETPLMVESRSQKEQSQGKRGVELGADPPCTAAAAAWGLAVPPGDGFTSWKGAES
jgi:hypothetical protein